MKKKGRPFNAFTDFIPRTYQQRAFKAFEEDGLDLALLWSRQMGKDLVSWLILIRQAMRFEGTYFYFLPMAKQARRAIWLKSVPKYGRVIYWLPFKKTGNLSRADGLGVGVYSLNNNSMIIELECIGSKPDRILQSSIEVIGANERNADDFLGVSPKMCVFSEVGAHTSFENLYKTLQPAILANNTRQILNGTPRGENHWYRFFTESKNDPKFYTDLTQVIFPEKEGYYPAMDVDSIWASAKRLGMSRSWVEQEFGCSFSAKVDGSFYSGVLTVAKKEGRVGDFPYNSRLPVDVFFDLGIRDKAVMWFRQLWGERVVFIDYFEGVNLGTDEVAILLKDKGYRYGSFVLPWDGGNRVHGRKVTSYVTLLKESLKDFKVSGTVPKPQSRIQSKVVGVELVRRRFPVYHFDEVNCLIALRHIANYCALRRPDGSFSDYPSHGDASHCCDGLRTEAQQPESIEETKRKIQKQYICDALLA